MNISRSWSYPESTAWTWRKSDPIGVLDLRESPCLSLSGCLITMSPLASHFRGAWLQWVLLPLTFGVLDYSEFPRLSLRIRLTLRSKTSPSMARHMRNQRWSESVLRNISSGISAIALRMQFCMSSGVIGSIAKTIPFT